MLFRFSYALATLAVLAAHASTPPPSEFATVNGARLEYLDWGGSGSPLWFLAGLGSTAHIFEDLAPEFNRIIDVWHLCAGDLEDRNRLPAATSLTAWCTAFSPLPASLTSETLLSWATLMEAPKPYGQPSYFPNCSAA